MSSQKEQLNEQHKREALERHQVVNDMTDKIDDCLRRFGSELSGLYGRTGHDEHYAAIENVLEAIEGSALMLRLFKLRWK